jgi:hypothetical protein
MNIQRGSNNRESLQSRLLERITTKNKAPEEIFLEAELSSEEETNNEVDEDDNAPTER